MASANEGFEVDPLHGGSFSRFLGSGDEASVVMEGGTGSFIFPAENTPKMLCFGNPCNQGEKAFGEYGGVITHQRLGINASDSSSTSSSNYSSTASFSNSKSESEEAKIEQKKRNGSDLGTVSASNLVSGASGGNRKTNKKAKTEYPTWKTGPVKARKEKLGERITALQQLVSPFGKTDTASVLHEAMGYIRFLQDQVQVLSSPYMQQQLPSSGPVHDEGRGKEEEEESKYNLRSRGLCLVPVACTVHVANNNWADLWSPANFNNSKQQ